MATLAYRGGKALLDAPAGFARFCVAEATRTPGEVLAHIGDLLDWAVSLVKGAQVWHETPAREWDADVARFVAGLQALDQSLATSGMPPGIAERLFQGPIADAFTHVGQIAMLRGMAGSPVRPENYFRAKIAHPD